MVLKKVPHLYFLKIFLITGCLSACSIFNSTSQSNRSPDKPVVPAESKRVLFPSVPQQQEAINPTEGSSNNQQQDQIQILGKPNTENNEPKGKPLKPADVLGSIIHSAKKAIENQQWLRAQHHLEHALRVAPKDAEVFYLYALVYEGLAVEKHMINMLKRAIFLASPNSDIYQLAEKKLANISP